jgi:hypothetical protein
MKPKPSKFYVMRLVVTGKRPFPIDMLRYDNATPATEVDAHAIERTWEGSLDEVRVTLRRFARDDDKHSSYHYARWGSYGWRVESYDYADAT